MYNRELEKLKEEHHVLSSSKTLDEQEIEILEELSLVLKKFETEPTTILFDAKQIGRVIKHLKTVGFSSDTCLCGTSVLKIDQDLYLGIKRACKRNGDCPDGLNWEITDISFYNKGYERPGLPIDLDPYDLLNKQLHSSQINILTAEIDELTLKENNGYPKKKMTTEDVKQASEYALYLSLKNKYENSSSTD